MSDYYKPVGLSPAQQNCVNRMRFSDEFNEAEHPRDPSGKFGSGGGTSAKKAENKPGLTEKEIKAIENIAKAQPVEAAKRAHERKLHEEHMARTGPPKTPEHRFREQLKNLAGLSDQEAEKAAATMIKLKVAKLNKKSGNIEVVHGAYLDPAAIKNAVDYKG